VRILGSGTSTLDDLPDMFVGDLSIAGHIGPGECRSTAGYSVQYPDPGPSVTTSNRVPFKRATRGKCYAKASNNTEPTPSGSIAPDEPVTSTTGN
jgi:hypothetical protein